MGGIVESELEELEDEEDVRDTGIWKYLGETAGIGVWRCGEVGV